MSSYHKIGLIFLYNLILDIDAILGINFVFKPLNLLKVEWLDIHF